MIKVCVLLVLMTGLVSGAQALERVLVNKPISASDHRYDYPHLLLQKVLDATREEYDEALVAPTEFVMSRDRMLASLIEGKTLHVVAEAPKPDWLSNLLVVRIPIRKGIQGYRLFFINKQDQKTISAMTSFNEFIQLPTGSGEGWSTTRVLREAGFNVVTGNNYEGLFDMLERRRFLTLGRGINEIGAEFEAQKPRHPNLAIETDFALRIPLPTYFFVSPDRPLLAKRIEAGLKELIKTGEFDAFFLSHHKAIIDGMNLRSRKVFSVTNPNLGPEDPTGNAALWYSF